ncbi:ATP-binding protein [uncultured Thiohalocapsa sp.]|uniref:ATP-binding protein n=1 Tax=uncultured Thiohalocapsa sp. TaxID=768990 RepID=UPI0025F41FB3|nr:ATP-binding protein [uncultured Thiohalocapsa sp.]
MNSPRKKLPIGIQTFREIREDDCYYVDKTPLALRLIKEGKYYFLSRPRRFGKSLFLDTLAELFEGNRELFSGLAAEGRWDWSRRFPVIRLSFGGGVLHTRDALDKRIADLLRINREALEVELHPDLDIAGQFGDLIRKAHAATGERVVVLVDEYDKPILDNLTDPAAAGVMRDGLRNLYSVIKDADAHVRFAFLTGVSKFSKVSIFSGLNNLKDITLNPRYSAICGYTEADLDTVFAPELDGLDREQIRTWYNGYNWTGEAVYNPYDVLLLFDERRFHPWWFETGTPTFLVEVLTRRGYFTPQLANLRASEALLSAFDVDTMESEALLWQTGYLTLTGSRQIGARWEYGLGYPNLEVESALNDALLKRLMGNGLRAEQAVSRLYDVLLSGDFEALRRHVASLFAAIPSDWYRNNPIARYEGYYASVFYSHLAALGLDLTPEDTSNVGRLDLALRFNGNLYLMEFKVVELVPEGRALEQIKAKGYADKYRAEGLPIHLLGIEFSKEQRALVGFEVETLSP